jgi:DNA mismatch repair protein MutL
LRQRISDIFGKSIEKSHVPVENNTSILNISGYIGKPEIAKKRNDEQYFFVNNRFMKHAYFYKALILAYDQILRPDMGPSFFLFLEINPEKIDINIHPAKIEINFDDSQGIFQLLRASIKQALGKYNIVPSIDFDRDGYIEMPYSEEKSQDFVTPKISNSTDYNPFENERRKVKLLKSGSSIKKEKVPDNWDSLYKSFESSINNEEKVPEQKKISTELHVFSKLFQLKNKYVVTPVKSGIMLIHITRAHERIIYESLLSSISSENVTTQKSLYPIEIQLSSEDLEYLEITVESLKKIGFDISFKGDDTIEIKGMPAHLIDSKPKELIESLLVQIKDDSSFLENSITENICEIIAKKTSLSFAKPLALEEMQYIINKLFACRLPNFTNDGRKIIEIVQFEAIEKMFK